jgi:hypothetical protein
LKHNLFDILHALEADACSILSKRQNSLPFIALLNKILIMMDINDNGLNNQEDFLNTDNDKMQDAANADAAKFNTDEQQRFVEERQGNESADEENLTAGSTETTVESEQPLTTQGDISEVEENMGGTTNLSLDQLKKEGDPEGMDGE